jgi:hypothetical protein
MSGQLLFFFKAQIQLFIFCKTDFFAGNSLLDRQAGQLFNFSILIKIKYNRYKYIFFNYKYSFFSKSGAKLIRPCPIIDLNTLSGQLFFKEQAHLFIFF